MSNSKSLVRRNENAVDLAAMKQALAAASGVDVKDIAYVRLTTSPEENRLVTAVVRAIRAFVRDVEADDMPTLRDLLNPKHSLMIEVMKWNPKKRENRRQPAYVHEELADAMKMLYQRKVQHLDWSRTEGTPWLAVQFALFNHEDPENHARVILEEAVKELHKHAAKGSRAINVSILWVGKKDEERESQSLEPTEVSGDERAVDAALAATKS